MTYLLLIGGYDLPGEWFTPALWGFNNEHIVTLAGGNSDGELSLGICITRRAYSLMLKEQRGVNVFVEVKLPGITL